MALFVQLTKPDGLPVLVNMDLVLTLAHTFEGYTAIDLLASMPLQVRESMTDIQERLGEARQPMEHHS